MITSKQSKTYKHLTKLLKSKKYRDEHGEFLVFGDHLISEAKRASVVKEIFTSNNEKEGTLITEALIKDLSQTKTHFDEIALCEIKNNELKSNYVLVLDDIQDPTNLGALLRSALAFNFNKVIVSSHSADIYNDKVIRSSQGAFFHLSIVRGNVADEIKVLKDHRYLIVGADAHEGANIIPNDNQIALVVGNEGSGISSSVKLLLDKNYQIKTNKVESLNVATAGAIIMYEFTKGRF